MQDEHIRIPLRRRDGTVVAHAVVDKQDAALGQFKWCRRAKGYVGRAAPRKAGGLQGTILLHRVILGLVPGDGLEGDHVNGDKLDCRRSNLRIVTSAGNSQNKRSQGGSSSYRGVSWDKREGRWMASAMLGGRTSHIGYFDSELAAARAASAWRLANMPYTNENRSGLAGQHSKVRNT